MDKRKAIQIITKSAELYRKNLENQKILFLYGIPGEIKRQLMSEIKEELPLYSYEVAFHRHNFLHLTGVRLNDSNIASATHFYEKCLDNRLTQQDFYLAKDGSTVQKLDILEHMMQIKKNAAMIGDFTASGPKLFAQKATGNVCGCVGFLKDSHTGLNVPNTLLRKDIRDVVRKPIQKIFLVFSKNYKDELYENLEKCDKNICLKTCILPKTIEVLLDEKIIEK